MGPQVLVTANIEGGRKLIEELARAGFPVAAAFWTKTEEAARWYLHIVSPVVDESGPTEAYRRVDAAIQACQWADLDEMVDTSSVKVMATTHPLVRRVTLFARRPVLPGSWIWPEWAAGGAVAGTFVYPVPTPTPVS